jgi:hypothetical protein
MNKRFGLLKATDTILIYCYFFSQKRIYQNGGAGLI